MDPGCTNPFIDDLFAVMEPFIWGGKLAGAGGGGYAMVITRGEQAGRDLAATLASRYPGTPVAVWPCALPDEGLTVDTLEASRTFQRWTCKRGVVATIRRFEELEAWQTARALTEIVYELTSVGAFSRDYGLRDQMRRAAVSVMSNIAEGFESRTQALFIDYLGTCQGFSRRSSQPTICGFGLPLSLRRTVC